MWQPEKDKGRGFQGATIKEKPFQADRIANLGEHKKNVKKRKKRT
jgi:hypothetical protein